MPTPRTLLPLLLAATLLALTATRVRGEETLVAIEIAEIGIGGVAKVGFWTPVRVIVKGEGQRGRVQVTAPDGDGVETLYTAHDETSLAGRREVTVYAKLGRMSSRVQARFVDSQENVLAETERQLTDGTKVLAATQPLILHCGPPVGVEKTLPRSRRDEEATRLVELADVAELPDHWLGLSAVNHLVLIASDSAPFRALSREQGAAIVRWLEQGGRLTISAGSDAEALFADSKFAPLSPGDFQSVEQQTRTSGLENFARATKRLGTFELSLFADVRGQVMVSDTALDGSERPVVMRYPQGFGMVTFLAADIDRPPFSVWPDRKELVAALLQTQRDSTKQVTETQGIGPVKRIGYTDLSGQLRSALDRFATEQGGVPLVTFSPIAAAIVLYILLIGPGDFFFLRKIIGRMEITWLTFPLIVGLFCGATVMLFHQLKGGAVLVNQVDLVDVDTTSSLVRGSTWANIYSPRTEAYNLELQTAFDFPNPTERDSLLAWQGLPGEGLGGLRTSATAAFFEDPYDIATSAERSQAIADMPIQVSSTKSVTAQWWMSLQRSADETAPASTLRRKRDFLRGELTNPFPVELTDCVLMFENSAYTLDGRLAPGATVSIAEFDEPQDLAWKLTGRRVVQSDFSYVATPWEPGDSDIRRIMEMLLFHQAAGGRSYTVLTHRYLDHLDLSQQLRHDRAILLGQTKAAACDLLRDGQPLGQGGRHLTFCRAVFAVAPEPTSDSE